MLLGLVQVVTDPGIYGNTATVCMLNDYPRLQVCRKSLVDTDGNILFLQPSGRAWGQMQVKLMEKNNSALF